MMVKKTVIVIILQGKLHISEEDDICVDQE
jgi:hypothetical protein